jgi:prepilin-type N-terminal cleavage/methylation domain-containing protein
MKMLCNKKGITLLELIIAVGLVAIIAGAAYTVLLTGVRTFNRNIDSTNAQSGLRTAMMKITKLEHSAGNVSATASSVTFTLSSGTHVITASGNQLKDNGNVIAQNVTAMSTTTSGKMLTVTLTGDNSATLTTQFYID